MNVKPTTNNDDERVTVKNTKFKLLKRFWKLILIQAVVSISISGLMLNMLGISNIIWPGEEFHSFEIGLLVSSKMLMVAVFGLFFGFLSDRISRKKLFTLVLLLMGISKIFNGFIPMNEPISSFILFIACYAALGVGQGGINPLIISYSNDACELNIRSQFFGLKEIFNQLFLILGMIISAWLISTGFWRIYFWSTGFLLLSVAISMFFILNEPKRASMRHEFKDILSLDIKYDYKLNRGTIKSTIFSNTNIITFIEGVFTWILFSIAIYLIYPFIQSPPYNVSPVVSSFLMIIFGIPGAIFGAITFSKISDQLAQKNIKNRIYLIVISMLILFGIVILLFILPLPKLSPGEANNLMNLLSYPIFLLFGILLFILRAVLCIYHINQTPILQIINLPEAQGTISSWNQFLEELGFGLGPIISGYLLTITNNYTETALIAMSIGVPSIFLWLLANKWIKRDIHRIELILEKRAKELSNENKKT
ncbi:MAG: MFS transporter [Candidatus Lokiarchaeota archaeon]|nr:MFS transporter [Candidatus Lokiarchaeota archaeon]